MIQKNYFKTGMKLFLFSSVPQIRWEWKRAFLRIWKLPTKIFNHIKKENPIHATLADAFLLQGRFLWKYIKRQIKWHSSQRKNFFMTFFWHLNQLFKIYILVWSKSLWCYQNLLKEDSMMKFSMLKSWKTNTSQDSSFSCFFSLKGLT